MPRRLILVVIFTGLVRRLTAETNFVGFRPVGGRARLAKALLGLALMSGFCPANPLVLTTRDRTDLLHNRFLESRRELLATQVNPFTSPAAAQVVIQSPRSWTVRRHPWHYQIKATLFWVGEKPTSRNPVSNVASSWDPHWEINYGGYDHPFKRDGFHPEGFEPKLNPFYVALPYNDLMEGHLHRPEAKQVIPWFWKHYRGPGVSVCHNRWIAIHHKGQVCYAQWKDVGPFTIDDWKYVFSGERPRPNPNQNAGIDISPAVRDFLGLSSDTLVDWRFVEDYEVPSGPWANWLQSSQPDPELGLLESVAP